MPEQAYRVTGWVQSMVGFSGATMNRRNSIVFGMSLWVAAASAGVPPTFAQTSFQTYRCTDGSQFVVGFFEYDKRAHLQIDGKAVTLGRRLSLSGSRYSGGGVTLTIAGANARLKRAGRPATVCEIY